MKAWILLICIFISACSEKKPDRGEAELQSDDQISLTAKSLDERFSEAYKNGNVWLCRWVELGQNQKIVRYMQDDYRFGFSINPETKLYDIYSEIGFPVSKLGIWRGSYTRNSGISIINVFGRRFFDGYVISNPPDSILWKEDSRIMIDNESEYVLLIFKSLGRYDKNYICTETEFSLAEVSGYLLSLAIETS